MANVKLGKDDEMTIIKNDLKKIMARPTMYISSLGSAGVLHLCKEIIDNNRDECYKKESPGDTIYIEITDKYICSRDNGRGIPTHLVREVHETLQAGSNMTRAGGETAGENGTGTSTYTAMARRLEVTSLRPQEQKKCYLVYENGELKTEKIEKYTGTEHGMITKFWPSKKIMGVDEIPVDDLINWLQDFRYTLPQSIHMTYNYDKQDHKIVHIPLNCYFDEYIKGEQRMSTVLTVLAHGDLDEIIMDKKYKRRFDIEACLVYSDPQYKGEAITKSWMNMIYTPQNGSHVDGLLNGFSRYIIEQAIKKNKKLASEDLRRDILTNLHVVVRATSNMAHMFSSQAKHTVFNKALKAAITDESYDKMKKLATDAVDNAIYKALKTTSSHILSEFVDICIANNRVRREGEKARDISKLTKEKKSWSKPDSFFPCSSANTAEGKELFLVEGLSAGGGLRAARDATYQAILAFRGKSPNVWDLDIAEALKSLPWLNLVKILGCGVGEHFNINKLNYDKIIIATDADIDGYHIRTLFLIFFFKFLPEIVRAGKLYVAEPPLYQLTKDKKYIYVASQKEYIDECIKSVSNIEIEFPMVG